MSNKKLRFLSYQQKIYNESYEFYNCEEKLCLVRFPNPNHYDNEHDYRVALFNWHYSTKKMVSDIIIPVPVSFNFRLLGKPRIPTAQEKIPKSQSERIAAKQFDVKNTPLYPDNHLRMQSMVIECEIPDPSHFFQKTGPRGQNISIINHFRPGEYWTNQYVPFKPLVSFYQNYTDYQDSMRKWYDISKQCIMRIPSPQEIGTINKLLQPDDTEGKLSIWECESLKEEITSIDNRFVNLKVNADKMFMISCSLSMLNRGKNFHKVIDNNEIALDLDSVNSIPIRELLNLKKDYLNNQTKEKVFKLRNNNLVTKVLYSVGASVDYRLSVFRELDNILNIGGFLSFGNSLKNNIPLYYSFASLVSEFYPNSSYIVFPISQLDDESDDHLLLNHSRLVLLEYHYNYILLNYSKHKSQNSEAYDFFKNRHVPLNMQVSQLLGFMSSSLLKSMKRILNDKTAPVISLIIKLILMSESPNIESFISNPDVPFLEYIVSLYAVAPNICEQLLKFLYFSPISYSIIFPQLFPLFSQFSQKKILDCNGYVLWIIGLFFTINPLFIKAPCSHFVPFYITRLIPDDMRQINLITMETIETLCTFFKRSSISKKFASSPNAIEDEVVANEAIKYLLPSLQFIQGKQCINAFIISMKELLSLHYTNETKNPISFSPDLFIKFLSHEDEKVSQNAWKFYVLVIGKFRNMRNVLFSNRDFIESTHRPQISSIIYILKLMIKLLSNTYKINEITIGYLLNAQSPGIEYSELKKFSQNFDVKAEGYLRTLVAHQSKSSISKHFYYVQMFQAILSSRKEKKK